MAKTTNESIAENKARQKEIDAVIESRAAIHQKQMEGIAERSAEKTQAVLDGTSEKLIKNQESTVTSAVVSVAPISTTSLVFGIGGFLLGVLIMVIWFSIKIKRIQKDCETRVNEARAALDRMLKIAAKD